MLLCAALARGAAAGVGGLYTDPRHHNGERGSLAGTRMLSDAEGGAVRVVGTDDGAAWWALTGAADGEGGLTVDFSPKGGPADLKGAVSDGKITWPDGNAWSRLTALSDDGGAEAYADWVERMGVAELDGAAAAGHEARKEAPKRDPLPAGPGPHALDARNLGLCTKGKMCVFHRGPAAAVADAAPQFANDNLVFLVSEDGAVHARLAAAVGAAELAPGGSLVVRPKKESEVKYVAHTADDGDLAAFLLKVVGGEKRLGKATVDGGLAAALFPK